MDRRDVLRGLGCIGVGGLAGCLDETVVSSGGPATQSGSTPTDDAESRPCPPIPFRDGRTRCDGSADDWSVSMGVEPTTLELPRDECTVELQNRGDVALESTADSVSLYAWRDGQWAHVVQKVDEMVLTSVTVPPGGRREFSVAATTADLGPVSPPGEWDGEQQFVFRLPPGTYALGYRVSQSDGDPFSGDDAGTHRVYARPFSVTGDAPALVPTDRHEETLRRDGTSVVRTGTEHEYDHSRRVTLRLERARTPLARVAPLSPFELYNPGYELVPAVDGNRVYVPGLLVALLRDAFATATTSDGRILVETVDTTSPPLGMQGSKTVRYGGVNWRLSATEGWETDR